jgi:MFS transporter, ACS family, hexuronate transporter
MTSELGSWRIAFQVVGASGLVWLLFWFALTRKVSLPAPREVADTHDRGEDNIWRVVFSRRMLIVFVVIASINTTWQILRAWLPKILQEGRLYSEKEALYFTSGWYAATDVGCIGAGLLAVWLGKRYLSVHTARVAVFALCGLLCATCALTPLLDKGWLLLTVFMLAGAGALGVFPLYHAFTQDISARHQGKITGLAGVVAWVIPAQAQKFFGRLADWTQSFDIGLVLAAFLPLIAVIPLWLFWNRGDPSKETVPSRS